MQPANELSMKYLELNFFTHYTVDAKRPKKLVNDILHFSVHYQLEEILYISTVLEVELCMGWKCT